MHILVNIDREEKNKCYNDFYGIKSFPFFVSGDSIRGTISVTSSSSGSTPPPLGEENVKIKSGKVSIIVQTTVHSTVINTTVLQTIQLAESEKISLPFKKDFVFDNFMPPFSSFIGANSKIEFFVEATFDKAIRTFQKQEKFYLVKPVDRVPSFREQTITVHCDKPAIDVSAVIKSSYLGNNQMLNGKIVVPKAEENSIEKAFILLTAEETIKHPQFSKPYETILAKYQIIDGTPRVGSSAPYCIQLSALKLWPLQATKDSLIRFKMTMSIFVETTDGESHSVAQSIGLYQPNMKNV